MMMMMMMMKKEGGGMKKSVAMILILVALTALSCGCATGGGYHDRQETKNSGIKP